jgi:hypothetical protein
VDWYAFDGFRDALVDASAGDEFRVVSDRARYGRLADPAFASI